MAVASLGCNIANSGLNGDLSDASSPSEVRVVVKNLHSGKVAGVDHLWLEIEKCLHFFSCKDIWKTGEKKERKKKNTVQMVSMLDTGEETTFNSSTYKSGGTYRPKYIEPIL